MVTAVVVTFAIAGVLRLSTRSSNVASRDSIAPRDHESPKLESDRYQTEIAALESMLYKEAPPSTTDFMTISAALHEVGFAIADREVDASARDVASDVELLAAQADVGEAGYALPDIAQLRADWESLRSQRFDDAEWFHESTPALEEAQLVATPEIDPSTIEDLRSGIDAIEKLGQEGRRKCDELGEPFYDFERPGAEGDAHIAAWNAFAREWEDDVSRAASLLPSPPSWDADPNLIAAYQDVTNALRELRHASMGSGTWPVPYEGEWSARFDEAERLLRQSTERLIGKSP
jgi:hypothetical protein